MKKLVSLFKIYPIIVLFFLLNLIIFFFSYLSTLNLYFEIIKFFQLLILFFLISFSKINKYLKIFFINIIYFVYLILIFFTITTRTSLDYFFLKRNLTNISSLFSSFGLIFFIIILIVFISSFFANYLGSKLKIKKNILIFFLAITVSCFFINEKYSNPIFIFAKSIYSGDENIDKYQNAVYQNLINRSSSNKQNIKESIKNTTTKNLPKYLDNIIFLQIESLNSFLVSATNTPNFLEISKQGVFFPKFYGNSVQTILGQENILCSLPSSFDINLVKSELDKNIFCLPETFNNLGYKTFFLKSYDLDFDKTGDFMKNIGFNEVHADSIMQEEDPKSLWGYREDIFYERVFEYLEKNLQKNNFIYIEIGPSNHWPFQTPADLIDILPFPHPQNHRERLIDTTFIQDMYLKIAWEKLNALFPEKNYTVLILGDHSWPAEMHEGNFFNQRYAYEENFLTSMIIILGNQEKYKGKVVFDKHSQMDIMPTLLDFYGIKQENEYNQSLKNIILENGNSNPEKSIILIQPYGNRYITLIKNGEVSQYDSKNNTASIISNW